MKDALQASLTNKEERIYTGILYGEFGVRKTTTALRCMENKAVLLHADRGWNVIFNHPGEFNENVVPVEYQGLSQVQGILQAIDEGIEPFAGTDLIVVDTISQMQENYIDFLLENAQYAGNYREKISPKPGVKDFTTTEIPGMPDYHLARNKFRPVVRDLVRAPVNVIFIAHTREPSPIERAAGKIERRPNVTEALYKVLARDANFIGYMEVDKKGVYTVSFSPKPTLSAKSQIRSISDKTINAEDLPRYLKEWSEGK